MKKLFIYALLFSALASCKKEDIQPERMMTVDIKCDACRITYNYKQEGVSTEVVKGGLIIKTKAKPNEYLMTQMFSENIGRMSIRVFQDGKEVYFLDSGENYPAELLLYLGYVVK